MKLGRKEFERLLDKSIAEIEPRNVSLGAGQRYSSKYHSIDQMNHPRRKFKIIEGKNLKEFKSNVHKYSQYASSKSPQNLRFGKPRFNTRTVPIKDKYDYSP